MVDEQRTPDVSGAPTKPEMGHTDANGTSIGLNSTSTEPHPRPPADIAPDPVPKQRPPLNPAYAILAGAMLTAITGITATLLTIKSSERLTRERDQTDIARQQRDELQKELDKVKTELANQSAQIDEFSSTTIPAATIAPVTVPPSIVVVFPSQVPTPTQKPSDQPPDRVTTAIPQVSLTVAPTSPPSTTPPPATTVLPTAALTTAAPAVSQTTVAAATTTTPTTSAAPSTVTTQKP